MKALLRKDFYTMVLSFRTVFLILVVFAAVSIFASGAQAFMAYLVLLPGTLATSIINLEEQEKWNAFGGTLPISRKAAVAEKYLFTLFVVCFGACLTVVCQIAGALRSGAGIGNVDPLSSLILWLLIGLLLPSFSLPSAYRFGVARGRYVTMLLIVVVTVFFIGFLRDGAPDITAAFSRVLPFSPILLLIPVAALFVFSMLLSMRIYERMELG